MSVIITEMDMPKCCGSCNMAGTDVCRKWMCLTNFEMGKKRAEDCSLKSIEGLIAFIKDHAYPVRYDRNSIENGMTITGIEQAIKEYCEVE